MSLLRIAQSGWENIGITCPAGRRSLWMRLTMNDGKFSTEEPDQPGIRQARRIELCAGREGDDAYVSIEHSNPAFDALLDVLLTAPVADQPL